MQNTAISLIDKIIQSNDKQESIINIMNLMLILKNLDVTEFKELKDYVEHSL